MYAKWMVWCIRKALEVAQESDMNIITIGVWLEDGRVTEVIEWVWVGWVWLRVTGRGL